MVPKVTLEASASSVDSRRPASALYHRLEVSLGKRSFLERAVPGGLLDPGRGGNAATFGILGLLAGGAIAAVAVPSERWTEVRWETAR